jgi:hypothetical protein
MLKLSLSGGVVRVFAKGGLMNMIRKFIVAVAATAVATSFLPTSSFAKKAKKQSCSVGQVCMKKPDKAGWGEVIRCTYDGKMIGDFSPCNVRSGMCPTAICKSKKK